MTEIQDSKFEKFFSRLPEKSHACVRFFFRNDYYSVYGKDAIFIAQKFYHTMAVVKYLERSISSFDEKNYSKEDDAFVNLSFLMFESTLRELLLSFQYRVEVYGRDKNYNWKLLKKGSPGNLQAFEDDLARNSEISTSPIVLSLNLTVINNQKCIGAAFSDTSSGKLAVCEFTDNDHFSNLEALHVQINAKECLLYSEDSNPDKHKLIKILQRSGLMITFRKKEEFSNKNIVQDLNRLLKLNASSATLPETQLKSAMCSLAAVINYLELLSDDSNFYQFELSTFDLNLYMRLDTAASKALNLTPSPLSGSNKSMSLTGLLDRCKTGQGRRLLERLVKQPLLDVAKIEERQNLVELFVEDTILRQTMQEEHLKKVPDLYRIARRFLRKQASLLDCLRLKEVVARLPALLEVLNSCASPNKFVLDEVFSSPLKELKVDFEKFVELIETTLEYDEGEHEVYIKPSYDEDLWAIRTSMEDIKTQISKQLQNVLLLAFIK
jgi:DNA mismatch repair protein MSH2